MRELELAWPIVSSAGRQGTTTLAAPICTNRDNNKSE